MIVVDTNLIAYLYLQGDRTALSEEVLKRDVDWAAPLLWRSEFRNVLATYLRAGRLSLEAALAIMETAEQQMATLEYRVPSDQVLSLCASSALSAYDCEFVWLAMDVNVPLVTTDKHIVKTFPNVALAPESFLCNKK